MLYISMHQTDIVNGIYNNTNIVIVHFMFYSKCFSACS